MSLLTDPANEFAKLDQLDKRLFFEIIEKFPSLTETWIQEISKDYHRRGISIDSPKFKEEVNHFLQFLEKSKSS